MLTDAAIRKAAKRDRPYKLYDSAGLYVHVTAAGGKSFRLKYRLDGREKLMTLGMYPIVTLALARERALQARRELDAGIDPSAPKVAPAPVLMPTFETVAREWHAKETPRWSVKHASDIARDFERDLFPVIGSVPVDAVSVPMLLAALRAIEARPAIETAHRLRQRAEAVFAYAISTARATANPAMQLEGALSPVNRTRRQPAVLTLGDARMVYGAVSAQRAQPETIAAHALLALTAQRSADVREAAWSELEGMDGPAPLWRIPLARMKGSVARKATRGAEHLVPLSPQAVAVIESVRPLTGHARLIFGTPRNPERPLSDNALGYLLLRTGFAGRHVPHGWRATFSTVMNERHPGDRAVIDLMLAHTPSGVEAAYNRARHMPRRRELANEWAALLTARTPRGAD